VAELTQVVNARDVQKLKQILDSGVNPNVTDCNERSALHLAVDLGFEDMITVLLDAGADYNLPDRWGITPYVAALNKEQSTVVNYLNQKNRRASQVLSIETKPNIKRLSRSSSIRDELNINESDQFDVSGPELLRACKLGSSKWVSILLNKGVDID